MEIQLYSNGCCLTNTGAGRKKCLKDTKVEGSEIRTTFTRGHLESPDTLLLIDGPGAAAVQCMKLQLGYYLFLYSLHCLSSFRLYKMVFDILLCLNKNFRSAPKLSEAMVLSFPKDFSSNFTPANSSTICLRPESSFALVTPVLLYLNMYTGSQNPHTTHFFF